MSVIDREPNQIQTKRREPVGIGLVIDCSLILFKVKLYPLTVLVKFRPEKIILLLSKYFQHRGPVSFLLSRESVGKIFLKQVSA